MNLKVTRILRRLPGFLAWHAKRRLHLRYGLGPHIESVWERGGVYCYCGKLLGAYGTCEGGCNECNDLGYYSCHNRKNYPMLCLYCDDVWTKLISYSKRTQFLFCPQCKTIWPAVPEDDNADLNRRLQNKIL